MYVYKQFCITEYYTVVFDALKEYSDKCVSTIREAISQINILLHHAGGQLQIQEKFK